MYQLIDDGYKRYTKDCYILHMFSLETMLLFMIAVICYQCARHRSKEKILAYYQYKNRKKIEFGIKNCMC